MSFTITLHGFPTKQDALDWIREYEGGMEQHFECETAMVDMEPYIKNLRVFEKDDSQLNLDVPLKHYPLEDEDDTDDYEEDDF